MLSNWLFRKMLWLVPTMELDEEANSFLEIALAGGL